MFDLYAEFIAITNALEQRGIEYAVCGGWAMALHGAPRATIDIDLLILADALDEVWQTAYSLGYDIKGLPMTFHGGAVEIRRVSKIDEASGNVLTLDLLLVTPELQDVWATRERVTGVNESLTVVSRAGLIKLKTISGRMQDLADIERLNEASQ